MKQFSKLALVSMFALLSSFALAAGDHAHEHDAPHDHATTTPGGDHHVHGDMQHSEMFLEERMVDGYKVSFHVMTAQGGMDHGGSHNLMIKIEQGDEVLKNVKVNSKVIHPNGDSETKMLSRMGDWYMNGYDLGHAGKHQLMILFKTADGKKHKSGVYYTAQ